VSQCHDSYEDPPDPGVDLPVRAADLMTADPVVVDPTATVRDIAQTMLRHDIRMVPVVDIGDQIVGVVSEADLLCRAGYPTVRHHSLAAFIDGLRLDETQLWAARREGLTAEEIMTTAVVTCDSDEPVGVVARRMLDRDVRTLPVLDRGRLVGMLSRHDVLRTFVRPDAEIRSRVARLLNGPVGAPGAVTAEVRDGVVVLTGSVAEPLEASIVCSIVRQIPGVLEVVDRIEPESRLDRPSLESAHG
jgi:CBS-domain-containing membrane protein